MAQSVPCHGSGGHPAFKATFDRNRDHYWWPTMQGDIQSYCTINSCDACQRRKTPHRLPPLPTGHVPVERPFQRVAIDLVEYKKFRKVANCGIQNIFTRLQCFVSNRSSDTFCYSRSNSEQRRDYQGTYPCGLSVFCIRSRVTTF